MGPSVSTQSLEETLTKKVRTPRLLFCQLKEDAQHKPHKCIQLCTCPGARAVRIDKENGHLPDLASERGKAHTCLRFRPDFKIEIEVKS